MTTTTSLRQVLRAARLMHRDDRGSMPLALVMVTFVLIFATIAATTAATQVVGNRSETTSRVAAWALDSTLNRAAEQIAGEGRFPLGLDTTAPSTWTRSTDGPAGGGGSAASSYSYRWWMTSGLAAIDVTGNE